MSYFIKCSVMIDFLVASDSVVAIKILQVFLLYPINVPPFLFFRSSVAPFAKSLGNT